MTLLTQWLKCNPGNAANDIHSAFVFATLSFLAPPALPLSVLNVGLLDDQGAIITVVEPIGRNRAVPPRSIMMALSTPSKRRVNVVPVATLISGKAVDQSSL